MKILLTHKLLNILKVIIFTCFSCKCVLIKTHKLIVKIKNSSLICGIVYFFTNTEENDYKTTAGICNRNIKMDSSCLHALDRTGQSNVGYTEHSTDQDTWKKNAPCRTFSSLQKTEQGSMDSTVLTKHPFFTTDIVSAINSSQTRIDLFSVCTSWCHLAVVSLCLSR